MTILITLQTIKNGLFKVKIKHENGAIDYKELSDQELFDFLQACEFFCETRNTDYRFIIPESIKKMTNKWLEKLEKPNNNSCDA
jgi:hypothetical protein